MMMVSPRALWLRLRALLAPGLAERELDDEMTHHLEILTKRYREQGLAPRAARRAARRTFGNIERQKEGCRSARRTRSLDELGFDLRHALRMLRRAPRLSALLIGILGIAIAGTVVGASLVETYVLRSLPFEDADRLVWILGGPDRETFANPEGLDRVEWEDVEAFEATIAWDLDGFNLTGSEGPLAVDGAWISPAVFPALGIRPAQGRMFDDADIAEGQRPAVISHSLWQRRWGGNPSIIGRSIRAASADRPFEESLHTVVGVLPTDFWFFNQSTDILLPLDEPGRLPTLAKLAAGVEREAAQASLDREVAQHVTGAPEGWRMALVSAQEQHTHRTRPVLWALVVAVVAVLLVSCANVAGALVARGAARGNELAIRSALGAGRGRLFRQLLAESLALGSLASAVGAGIAWLALRAAGPELEVRLGSTVPGGVGALAPDATVLALGIGLALLVTLGFGVIPGWIATRGDVGDDLASARGRIGSGRRGSRALDMLVVAQIALTLTLLVGAGLMLRTVDELADVQLGFEPEGVMRASLMLPADRYEEPEARVEFVRALREVLASRADVDGVSIGFPYPFRPGGTVAVHRPDAPDGPGVQARAWIVDPDWHGLLDVEVLRGRAFESGDRDGAPLAALVSGTLADRLWPGLDPLGRSVAVGAADAETWTVVGVVREVRKSLTDPSSPDLYVPFAQSPVRSLSVLVRSAGDSPPGAAIEQAVQAIDRDIPIEVTEPLAETVARAGGGQRFLSGLLVGLGAFAALLAAVGLYSTIAYNMRRRRQEFAVRLALGADPGHLLGRVLLQGGGKVALGLAIGVVASGLATLALRSQLFGVETTDPLSYLVAIVVLGGVAFLAIGLPARRVGAVDPARVLREE